MIFDMETDYESIRKNNLKENQAYLKDLLKDLKGLQQPRRKSAPVNHRKSEDPTYVRKNPVRASRFSPYTRNPPVTRARSRRGSLSSHSSECSGGEERLLVRFGLPSRYKEDPNYEEEEEEKPSLKSRKRGARYGPRAVRPEVRAPGDITDEEFKMVALSVKEKSYDPEYGSSCHQCRQKTLDFKTICRGDECVGVRGQFCGPCLRNRYGEDIKEALLDPNWSCPPCRGICNCSICRRRSGKCCTGILVHLAKDSGYSNAADYLDSFKK